MLTVVALALLAAQDPVVIREFLYERAPYPSVHSSTLAETKQGLVAAWFGGTAEGKDDVAIYVSRHDGKAWSEPVRVADGTVGDKRYPSWNPVLFPAPGGDLVLYFKIGPDPDRWWGLEMRSRDGGATWSKPTPLAKDIMGPVRTAPLVLSDGTILSPTSREIPGGAWFAEVERSTDGGTTWKNSGPLNDPGKVEVIQPAFLPWPDGRIQMLLRNRNNRGIKHVLVESWSTDQGRTWSPMKGTAVTTPNSGFAAMLMKDGRAILIYNKSPRARTPLNVAVSADGKEWKDVHVLESDPGEYSYPSILQAADGRVHATYTWKRERVRHVALDPGKLK